MEKCVDVRHSTGVGYALDDARKGRCVRDDDDDDDDGDDGDDACAGDVSVDRTAAPRDDDDDEGVGVGVGVAVGGGGARGC